MNFKPLIYNEPSPDYIRTLQVSAEKNDVSTVIACMSALAEQIRNLPAYHASELWFKGEPGEGAGIYFSYWEIDTEDVKMRNELQAEYSSAGIDVKEIKGETLQMLQVQHTKGRGQHDVADLFAEAARQLQASLATAIYDMALNDVDDPDSTERPLIRIYYLI